LPASKPRDDETSPLHLLRVLGGFLLLLLPGVLAFRFFVPDGDSIAEGLGMIPSLSLLILLLTGTVVVAIMRGPFDAGIAWITVLLSTAAGAVLFMRTRRSFVRTS
jgi:uncharacterized membrane protein